MQTNIASSAPKRPRRDRRANGTTGFIEPDRFYEVPETFKYTGARQSKTYILMKAGTLRFTKVGSRTFITGTELIRYRREELGIPESA